MTDVFRIDVGGESVIFYPNFKLKVLIKSVLFVFQPESPSRIFTWKVPAEPNETIFKFLTHKDNRDRIFTYPVKLFFLGHFWTHAVLDITDFNEREYSIRVKFDRGFYQDFASRSLRSFEYKKPYAFRYELSSRAHTNYLFNAPHVGTVLFPAGTQTEVTISYKGIFESALPAKEVKFVYTVPADGDIQHLYDFVREIYQWFNDRVEDLGFWFVEDGFNPLEFRVYQLFGLYVPSASGMLAFNTSNPMDVYAQIIGFSTPDQAAETQLLYKNAIDGVYDDYIFFPVLAPNMFDPHIAFGFGKNYINMFKPKITGNPAYPGNHLDTELVPFPMLKYVIERVHKEVGVSVARDDFFDNETSGLAIVNDWPMNDLKYPPAKSVNWSRGACFRYSDILPDTTIGEVINNLRYTFNTVVDYSSRHNHIRIIPIKNILSSRSYKDWTNKTVAGFTYTVSPITINISNSWPATEELASELLPDLSNVLINDPVLTKTALLALPLPPSEEVRLVVKENIFYRFSLTTNTWSEFAQQLYPYNVGGDKDITTNCSTLFTNFNPWPALNFGGLYNAEILLPYTKARSSYMPGENQPSPFRLLFYRGMRSCKVQLSAVSPWTLGLYPMASAHNYDINGIKIGNYSLAWNGNDGLYNVWYKTWLNMLEVSSPMKFKFTLSVSDILELDVLEKFRLENQLYQIDEIEFEINENTVDSVIVLVTAYPVKDQNNA